MPRARLEGPERFLSRDESWTVGLSAWRRGLRIVSVRIPEDYYEAVMTLVERGLYPSLSEAIRRGLSLLLQRDGKALLTMIREQERERAPSMPRIVRGSVNKARDEDGG
jgi:Arc/MetJ-type ribon-helix-helix transcriptional regulator